MRGHGVPFAAVVLLLAAACGGDGGSSSHVTESTAPGSDLTTTGEVELPTTTADAPSTTVAPVDDALPQSYYQFGADGLVRFVDGQAERLVSTPVAYATSDGVGGVLYSEWSPTELGTRWLPADTDESRFVWDGYRAIPALLDGRSVIVASFATDECFSDVPNMVARDLETGADTTLQCGTGGPDDGWGPNSYGGGLYVGDAWSAVTDQGAMLSSIGLVFRDERGAIIEHPANPYSDDCHPCELTAALSPDGERLAVIYRPDALQFRNENWGAETVDVPAELQVFDLRTGDLVFQHQLSAGAQPRFDWTPWFDGRFLALGPDRFDYPSLYRDSTGDKVRNLQRMLVAAGFDIEVDGIYGPGTRAAVEAFHIDRFGASRPQVGTDTWTELGVPDTIIDTHTGITVELPGAVALEVTLTEAPVAGRTDPHAELPVLRSDGLGDYDFGEPANQLVDELTAMLGSPVNDTSYTPDGPGPFEFLPLGYWALYELRVLAWDEPDLRLVLSDVPYRGDHWDAAVPGTLTLVSWATTSSGLAFSNGLAVGSSTVDLRTEFPDTVFGTFDVCETSYNPAGFVTVPFDVDPPPQWLGARGELDWDWISEMQRALNELGASLVIDGEYGPSTRAALQEYQLAEGIDQGTAPDANGLIGPETANALGLEVPDEAHIVSLAAGYPGSC